MKQATNYIYAYYQEIQNCDVIVGKWIKLWYWQVIKRLEAKEFIYEAKKAEHAISFIERYCRHHEGALAPKRVTLELWQKAFLAVVFGCVEVETRRRYFREVILEIGRKNGKTLLAAAITAYMAYADGEYGGRIYHTAPKLQQANLCFNGFYQMVQTEPELNKRAKKRRTDIYLAGNNTTIAPLAFSAKKSDGFNISLGICDEIASWSGDQGLKFYEVLKSSFGARTQPLLLSISTAGYVTGGIFDELITRSTAVILGNSQERRLAPFLYMIDDIEKWNDINEMAKANPNLGVSITVDYLLEEIRIAEGSLSKKAEVLTKYCNIKQNSSHAWLSAKDINEASSRKLKLEDFASNYAVVGIDLSQTTDLTSACVVIEKEKELFVFSHFWLPSAKLEEATARDGIPYNLMIQKGFLSLSGEGFIDYKDVFEWCARLVSDLEILPLMVGYDRYSAVYLIQELKQAGFHTDDVYQGFNLYPGIQEIEGRMKEGTIHFDNDLLKAHFLDTALLMDSESRRARIVKLNRTSHIDGVAAFLDAIIVRQKWFEELGEQLKNEE